MTTTTRSTLILALGITVGICLSIAGGVLAKREGSEALPLEALRNFTEVYTHIKRDYVESIDDKTLLEHAIRGMLSGLDPHSSYLSTDDYQELKIGTSGEFGGLGIEVGMENGFVKVVAPIDDTPAQRAGIEAGDLITRLDDKPVKGMTLNDAVTVMRGKPGSDITLTVVREGVDKPLKITITRAIIQVQSIKGRLIEDSFAYIRITQFQSKTTRQLINLAEKLRDESSSGLRGAVLDLRNNPGGVLNAAVGVSDAFLERGLIVYTQGRDADSEFRYSARSGDVLDGLPLVVLVNAGSASASEIVAGALQDHGRAVIMGSSTFGKGSVQTIQELNHGGAIKLTTARYYTPSGRSIQAQGITPDIELKSVKVTAEGESSDPVKEADLNGHLDGEEGGAGESKNHIRADSAMAESDFQLFEAINLLKGLAILRKE